jgi:serine/threonine protein kinase
VAPEVLLGGQGCTLAVDIFSYGVLLWEIITGSRPVRGHMRSIQVPAECPRDAADLMTACCALDPAARPTARDLMKRLQAMLVAQKEGRRSEFDG